jgi:hypothetical protein
VEFHPNWLPENIFLIFIFVKNAKRHSQISLECKWKKNEKGNWGIKIKKFNPNFGQIIPQNLQVQIGSRVYDAQELQKLVPQLEQQVEQKDRQLRQNQLELEAQQKRINGLEAEVKGLQVKMEYIYLGSKQWN